MTVRERLERAFSYEELMSCMWILGGYVQLRPLRHLVALIADEMAHTDVRDMLGVLTRKKKLAREGRGGNAAYRALALPRGGEIVQRKKEFASRPWDGRWSILTYDVPTSDNYSRRRLARLVREMGFAPLSRSSWVSPYDWSDVLGAALAGWCDRAIVSFARCDRVIPVLGEEKGCSAEQWDLDEVAGIYARIHRLCDQVPAGSGRAAQRARARNCLLAARQLARVEFEDPMLPAEIRPSKWPRGRAAKAFEALKKRVWKDVKGGAQAT